MRRVFCSTAALCVTALFVLPLVAEAVTAADVARKLREEILATFECEDLEVSVVAYPDQRLTDQGRFKSVTVRAGSASRAGIVMRPLYTKGTDVVFDMAKMMGNPSSIDTKSRGATVVHVEITEDDLTKGLRMAQDVIPDLAATLNGGQITLTGTYRLLVGNKFKMAGKLVTKDGYKIDFVPTAVKVNGVPIPVSGIKVVLAKINPLLDMSTVVMKPKMTTMTVENGKLVVE